MEHYFRRKSIGIAAIPLRVTNDLLEEYKLLIFSRIGVSTNEVDIVACQRIDSTDRSIVKLLNQKNAVKLADNKNKVKHAGLYEKSS